MKKLLGILFLVCLLIPFLGTYSWLNHHTRMVRREMRRRIEAGIGRDELTEFVFAKREVATLDWEGTDEFEYNGRMYDVSYSEAKGDSLHYWCVPDNEETELKKQVSLLVAHFLGDMPQRKENQRQLTQFFTNLYHSEAFRWRAFFHSKGEFNPYTCHLAYYCIPLSPVAPPPEVA